MCLQKNYDSAFTEKVYGLEEHSIADLKSKLVNGPKEIRVTYTDKNSFKSITKILGIMQDFKVSVIYSTGYLRGI